MLVELLELRTCLTVAEKALLWQAPRTGLEASMVLEASMMFTGNAELKRSRKTEGIAGCEMRSNRWAEEFERSEARHFLDFQNALCQNESSRIQQIQRFHLFKPIRNISISFQSYCDLACPATSASRKYLLELYGSASLQRHVNYCAICCRISDEPYGSRSCSDDYESQDI